jgi:hypothetical protein
VLLMALQASQQQQQPAVLLPLRYFLFTQHVIARVRTVVTG